MGTRADFYIGRGLDAEWLGSIAWDGYPDGIAPAVLSADTESTFRAALAAFFTDRNDVTLPDQGWPWPWDDSGTTDYTYAFVGNEEHWGGVDLPRARRPASAVRNEETRQGALYHMEAFTWFGIAVLVFICAALSGPMVSDHHPHDRYGVGGGDDDK